MQLNINKTKKFARTIRGIACEYRSACYKQLPYNPIIGYWKTINPMVFPSNIDERRRQDWESTWTCYSPGQPGLVRVVKGVPCYTRLCKPMALTPLLAIEYIKNDKKQ